MKTISRLKYPGSLHNHTEYSNLRLRDSINKIDELVNYAIELGHEVIAITEHDTVANAIKVEKYYNKIKQDHPDFKIILGNEIYLTRDGLNAENFIKGEDKFYHFILLAKDAKGHQQIRELSTRAHLRSFKQGRMRRVPTYYQDLIDIIGAEPGHIIGSSACFTAGQKVKTLNGDKNIEDITSNDIIMTANGEWEKINFPTSRYYKDKGNIIEFAKEPLSIKCTKNHQFLTYDFDTEKLNWIEAQSLKKGDRCLEPIPTICYSNINVLKIENIEEILNFREKNKELGLFYTTFHLPDVITLTPYLMRLFGLWLGDGHISYLPEKNRYTVGFTFSSNEFDIFYNGFVKEALGILGLTENDYQIHHRIENNTVHLVINKVEICLLFKYLFGISHADTKFVPNNLLHLNEIFDEELFFGYYLSDGYARYRQKYGGEVVFASISKRLIKDFELLGNSIGLSGSITISAEHTGKDRVHHQTAYYLSYSNSILGKSFNKSEHIDTSFLHKIIQEAKNKKGKFAEFIKVNNITYRIKKVKKNEIIDLDEQVYCLNTNSHSFVLNNIVVHNCLGGFLPSKILQYLEEPNSDFYNKILNWCKQMEALFGKGNFYLEMQPSASKEQCVVNKELVKISNTLGIPFIITNDSHYKCKEDAPIHTAFLKSQDGEREVASFYATTYLMNTEEIEEYMKMCEFDDDILQRAYQSILDIKNQCENYSLLKELKIPCLKWRQPKKDYSKKYNYYIDKMPYLRTFKNSDFEGDRLLVDLIIEKIESDKRLQDDKIYVELNDNLKITWESSLVNKTHWSAYFLNLQNIIDVCWNAGSLVGPGRGSGVGFLLLYILDIIQINPKWERTETFSWRFLNPQRVSVLD